MQGKVVLVTGAARRVGRAIAVRLHSLGASVMIHYRNSGVEADRLCDELNFIRPDSAATVRADLHETAIMPLLVQKTLNAFGRLDALVNNASSFFPTPVGKITEADWNDLVGSNLKAPLFLSQAAAEELGKNQGAIVNIVDIHAAQPMLGYPVYSTAKGGLLALTRSLARELAPNVRVNGVAPGPILWPEDDAWADEEERRRIIGQTLLGRSGEPDDIARTVAFLIADAPYITGQIIAVDGGRSVNL